MLANFQLQSILSFLHHHPTWGGGIAFLIAFVESFPVLGAIIPGTITMTMIGAAIGAGILPLLSTLIWTLCGAIAGDSSGYLLGRYFQDRIASIWPFTHHPRWLISGKNFFAKHGGKSIFMGFYMGPIRSMVPLTAGILNFSMPRFFCAILPSACVWAFLYTSPGFLLGKFSLSLSPKLATELLLLILLGLFFLWLVLWCFYHACNALWSAINWFFSKSYRSLEKNPYFRRVSLFFQDPENPNTHYQWMRLFFIILFSLLFIASLCNILQDGSLTTLNAPVYVFLRSLRTHLLTPPMIAISLLSDKRVMWASSLFIALWLFNKKHRSAAFYLLGLSFLTTLAIFLFKYHISSLRPPESILSATTNSLPSGHTTLSITLLLFLTSLLSKALSPKRKLILSYCSGILIFLIALSRLYLGAHWLSDILASLLLAIPAAFIALFLYYRGQRQPLPTLKFLSIILLSLAVSWAGNTLYAYKNMANLYINSHPFPPILDQHQWLKNNLYKFIKITKQQPIPLQKTTEQ